MRTQAARPLGRILLLMGLLGWIGCAGQRPTEIGVHEARLTPCPSSPNCVASDASAEDEHHIAPLPLVGTIEEGWRAAIAAVASLPRTQIIAEREGYLHAECTSALVGYVDDLELHLRPDDGNIAVRSASRIGYSDMGVNRERVEALRTELEAKTP